MKELSIEERAQRYDEAIERAKKWYNAPNVDKIPTFGNRVIEEIFPELREESEDERIRREIITYLSTAEDKEFIPYESWLAWLEKQKTSEEAIQYLKENHSPSEVSDFQTAMNIAVAKAYDKGVKDGLGNKGQTFTKKDVDNAYLAGVRDAKKELKKISQRMISAEAKEAIYGKPAWSEEDDDNMMMIEDRLRDYLDYIREDSTLKKHIKNSLKEEVSEYIDWLKSIKQRIGG